MPQLLRFSLGAIVLVLVALSVVVPAVLGGDPDAIRLTVWTVALTLLAIPGLLGALYVSYWTWSGEDARRRLRRLLVALGAIQAVGAVALLAVAAPTPRWLLGTVVVVVVGLALDPAMLAIGRAARRIESRRVPPTTVPPELDREIRAGWRRGGIGAAIGLAAGLLLLGGLSLLLDPGESVVSVSTIALAASFALIGASIGMLTKSLQLSRRIREELGSDYSRARRIGRVVAGKTDVLDPDDEPAAARYAAIAMRWQPFQLTASSLILIAVAVQQLGSLIDAGRLAPERWFSVAILVVAVLVAAPMAVVRGRRVRRFAAAHRVPVD